LQTDPEVKKNYLKLIEVVKGSKKDLIENGGYDEVVLEDFYETFLGAIQKLEELQ